MADRRKKSWGTFKNEMKAKRRKTGDGCAKKNKRDNILERQELVVQRLSSEVSGKAQKYTRVWPCGFVQYDEEELSFQGIKPACEKHFSPSLERKGLSCDVLAGEQGPSCPLNEAHSRFKGDPRTIYQVIEHTKLRGRYRFTKALLSRWTRFVGVCNRPAVFEINFI